MTPNDELLQSLFAKTREATEPTAIDVERIERKFALRAAELVAVGSLSAELACQLVVPHTPAPAAGHTPAHARASRAQSQQADVATAGTASVNPVSPVYNTLFILKALSVVGATAALGFALHLWSTQSEIAHRAHAPAFTLTAPRVLPAPSFSATAQVLAALPTVTVMAAVPAAKSAETQEAAAAVPSRASEFMLVEAMQSALLAGQNGEAERLAYEHAREFPHGALIEERESVRAIVACQNAAPEGRTRVAESFAQRFPASIHLGQVRRRCQIEQP